MVSLSVADYDDSHPVIYIKNDEGQSLALRIRRKEGNALWIDYSKLLTTKAKFDAYVVAPNQKGIIEFTTKPLINTSDDKEKFDVIKIIPTPDSIRATNRRQFFRLNLPIQLEADLIDTYGENKSIWIQSISAGGISFTSDSNFNEDDIYLMKVAKNFELDLNFAVQLLKPRSLGVSITNENALKSKIKIPAFFITSKNQTHFNTISDKQQSAIIQHINNKIRQEQKIKK